MFGHDSDDEMRIDWTQKYQQNPEWKLEIPTTQHNAMQRIAEQPQPRNNKFIDIGEIAKYCSFSYALAARNH